MSAVGLDLGLALLDHQVVDRDGVNCGKVDDLEIGGLEEGAPEVVAILVGAAAWRGRGRIGRLATALTPRAREVRVPWSRVVTVSSLVRLDATAAELGLGGGDGRWARLLRWIPGA